MTANDQIEQIKQLKARYFRYLDTKQWDAWRECFTEDFTGLYEGPHPDIEFGSRSEFIDSNRQILESVVTVHQGHTPEITLNDDDNATGIWAMYDRVEMPGAGFEGWGHYHEVYRRVNREWRIARIHLTRIKVSPLPDVPDSD